MSLLSRSRGRFAGRSSSEKTSSGFPPTKADKLPPLILSPNAEKVLAKRYLRKGDDGEPIETPLDMFRRVAHNIASAERAWHSPEEVAVIETEFLRMMISLEFLPNSPTLMNAGRELQQLSACFVLPVGDSMESIFTAIKNTALIHKSGGGTGFSFSRIRPKNDRVQSTKGISSGPVSFMKVFDAATETIKQGGTRRGANMGILRVDHPDIMEFISAKEEEGILSNFNLSVALTDEFMEAVEKGNEYPLMNPRDGHPAGRLQAKDVFSTIVNLAWKNGEPGIIFIDRINRDNATPALGAIESTNPCGEQPLLPYESCNLGSINLSKMVKDENGGVAVDYDKLRRTVQMAVRFLDNVIEMNHFPLPEIEETTKSNRKIGLGVMGFADLLIRLGIPYDSEDALQKGDDLMEFIRKEAREASAMLGKERGAFPNFEKSVFAGNGKPLRNATTTTIAPTGTLSILAGCSSGIEPLFAVCYERHILDKEKFLEVHSGFETVAKEHGFYSKELIKKVAEKGSIRGFSEIPESAQRVFVTAHEILPEWHVRMQSAFQKHVDNAVSKTVNFPNHATVDDVNRVYLLAYHTGCKGVTIYRDGSRNEQVLTRGGTAKTKGETEMPGLAPRPRPCITSGTTEKITTGCGNLYVTINMDEEGLCEVFSQMGKGGGCAASQAEAVSRLVSLALRSGVEIESVLKQLRGIRCPSPVWQKGAMVFSCPDAIAKCLERHMKEKAGVVEPAAPEATKAELSEAGWRDLAGVCPECGGMLEYVEGCAVCRLCGFSRCG